MEKNLYLLSQILNLSSSEIKDIIDSGKNVYELIFSNGDYLQECLKLEKSLITKLSALRQLIEEISFEQLRKREKIGNSEDAVEYLKTILSASIEENGIILFLNNGNAIVDQVEVRGSRDCVQIDYNFVVKRALVVGAAGIICAHNHPSGNENPSIQDIRVTLELKKKYWTFYMLNC